MIVAYAFWLFTRSFLMACVVRQSLRRACSDWRYDRRIGKASRWGRGREYDRLRSRSQLLTRNCAPTSRTVVVPVEVAVVPPRFPDRNQASSSQHRRLPPDLSKWPSLASSMKSKLSRSGRSHRGAKVATKGPSGQRDQHCRRAALHRRGRWPASATIGLGDLPYSGPTAALTDVWRALRASMRSVLEETTLADVAAGTLPSPSRKWRMTIEVRRAAAPRTAHRRLDSASRRKTPAHPACRGRLRLLALEAAPERFRPRQADRNLLRRGQL